MIEWLVSFMRTTKMRRGKITAGLFFLMSSSFDLITVLCCIELYCIQVVHRVLRFVIHVC